MRCQEQSKYVTDFSAGHLSLTVCDTSMLADRRRELHNLAQMATYTMSLLNGMLTMQTSTIEDAALRRSDLLAMQSGTTCDVTLEQYESLVTQTGTIKAEWCYMSMLQVATAT